MSASPYARRACRNIKGKDEQQADVQQAVKTPRMDLSQHNHNNTSIPSSANLQHTSRLHRVQPLCSKIPNLRVVPPSPNDNKSTSITIAQSDPTDESFTSQDSAATDEWNIEPFLEAEEAVLCNIMRGEKMYNINENDGEEALWNDVYRAYKCEMPDSKRSKDEVKLYWLYYLQHISSPSLERDKIKPPSFDQVKPAPPTTSSITESEMISLITYHYHKLTSKWLAYPAVERIYHDMKDFKDRQRRNDECGISGASHGYSPQVSGAPVMSAKEWHARKGKREREWNMVADVMHDGFVDKNIKRRRRSSF